MHCHSYTNNNILSVIHFYVISGVGNEVLFCLVSCYSFCLCFRPNVDAVYRNMSANELKTV